MRGRHSEVGKVELGAYIREKDDSCSKKGYTSSLNSHPNLKNQVECPCAKVSNNLIFLGIPGKIEEVTQISSHNRLRKIPF